jgi:hypothetical protein
MGHLEDDLGQILSNHFNIIIFGGATLSILFVRPRHPKEKVTYIKDKGIDDYRASHLKRIWSFEK